MNRLKSLYYSMIQGFGGFIAKTKWCYDCGSRLDTMDCINELENLRKGTK